MSEQGVSRRDVLRAGLAGAAVAATPASALVSIESILPSAQSKAATAPFARTVQPAEPPENLSASESETLDAIVARLIPTDANGPGATEARAARYIDRALGGALAASRPLCAAGLAAIEAYAQRAKGSAFSKLSAAEQDALLAEVEKGSAAGFANSAAFFDLVRNHTLQGTFCDPYYGGNANFVGWDLLGYPGVRTVVTPDEQRMDRVPAPNHKSAYDYGMFTKAVAQAGGSGEPDGD